VHILKYLCLLEPGMEFEAANAEWILQVLLRPGAKYVE